MHDDPSKWCPVKWFVPGDECSAWEHNMHRCGADLGHLGRHACDCGCPCPVPFEVDLFAAHDLRAD